MELTIRKIGINKAKTPLAPYKIQEKESLKTNNNSVSLPGYAEYITRIPFGNSYNFSMRYTGEDFLLPKNCVPDEYQIKAADALARGDNTIVTAPTGTGKTAIAYFIIKKNMKEGKRTFYTAPLKALSNQKYNDLKNLFGENNVGILTGDRKENVNAPIVLMTTEIYRNMVASNYFDKKNSQLDNLQTVVFDEFHYMGDPDRGSVWEESIMFTPRKAQILALSATVGNNKRITNWIKDKKGQQTTLIDVPITNRHVPLEFSVIKTEEHKYNDMLEEEICCGRGGRREWRKEQEKISRNPMTIIKTIEKLNNANKLPAIVFVFSKFFTKKLIDVAETEANTLTTKEEQKAIQNILNRYRFEEGFYSNGLNVEALLKGYATHSAAILPLQKQLIEELFNKKLIKVVFATETLSAGINMPARSVVLTDCEKPSGDKNSEGRFMRPLMPNEFHQMSGRAGRRGIDTVGHVFCLSESNEKSRIYHRLINSSPNSIQSNFKIDASSVANFYEITTDRKHLDHILDKSFGLYGVPEEERAEKRDVYIKDFEDYSRLLAMYRFIQPAENGYSTTQKGVLINRIQGRPQIPVIQSIFKQFYKDIDIPELAGLLASITMPLAADETKINQGIKLLQEDNEINLEAINERINDILRNELHIKKDKLDAKNRTNDQIIKYIQDRYGHMFTKSLDELRYEYDKMSKKK